jgi:hypothetical protein
MRNPIRPSSIRTFTAEPMSQVAAIVAYLALAGAVASWIAGAWFYAATVRDLSERPGRVNWFTVAAWPFALGRLKGAPPPRTVRVNKALIVCLACLTVAVAATSIATNLARVSR